ncbi:MAG: homocysteine S-methyltransferase [Acidobacteriota bacterium]
MAPSPTSVDLLQPFFDSRGYLVLDGGLATALEARGFDLDDPLWSARLLLEDPAALEQLHFDYLEAGADCLISASYQASFEGLGRRGLGREETSDLLRRSVQLARQARERFWTEGRRDGRCYPLVAASVGPYGAILADGSEYTGAYGLDEAALVDFHAERFEVLATSGADLLACETIPSSVEARALRQLLEAEPGIPAWISFSCRDGEHLSDGSELAEAVAELAGCRRLIAVGVNCTAPHFIPSLIERLQRVSELPIVVYPNSGEGYDAVHKRWLPQAEPWSLASSGSDWLRAGARLIGGCCRTGLEDIQSLRSLLLIQETDAQIASKTDR